MSESGPFSNAKVDHACSLSEEGKHEEAIKTLEGVKPVLDDPERDKVEWLLDLFRKRQLHTCGDRTDMDTAPTARIDSGDSAQEPESGGTST